MKIDKANHTLVLMANYNGYEGTFNVVYKDKLFGKETDIIDYASISEEKRPMDEQEVVAMNQVNKIIKKEIDKKGYTLENWTIHYSVEGGTVTIDYRFGETLNSLELNLINDSMITKKCLYLARKISRRMLKELK